MVLKVCDLKDGDSRATYKTTEIDLRTYKRIKMFVHAEELDPLKPLNNDDVTLFFRLGTDYTENYYEYELPLKITPWGANIDTDIWPEDNFMEIIFQDLFSISFFF